MHLSKAVRTIRTDWALSDAKRDEGLKTPETIARFGNISYGPYGQENLLDIYVDREAAGLLPTIVNIHGGGWVYGSKEIYQYYCMSLVQYGFTVVNINYRLAPETHFPGAVEDINQALTYLAENGAAYHVDRERLVLVGDSAGGQLVSHYATILTNPEFAGLFDFKVPQVTVKAVGLNCGHYDGRELALKGRKELFAEYLGHKWRKPKAQLLQMVDAKKYMTNAFPPAYIMSSECDFLREEARPMYDFLQGLGVPCEVKIYGSPEREDIGHVFQVNVKLQEAAECNREECAFFKRYV